MYGEIAKRFHEKFIGGSLNEETMKIAHDYVKFIIDTYEDMWEDYAKTYQKWKDFDGPGEGD